MVKRVSHSKASCPVARPLDAIGDNWSMLIIRDAFEGSTRFGEFQTSLGLARNILSARLKNLVDHEVLSVSPAREGQPYPQYHLTPKGHALFPLLVALRQWGEDHFFSPGEPHVQLVDRRDGRPVRRIELFAHDGRSLDHADTRIKRPRALAG
jgi:DNA-binding HxlR family transcriptional regulator